MKTVTKKKTTRQPSGQKRSRPQEQMADDYLTHPMAGREGGKSRGKDAVREQSLGARIQKARKLRGLTLQDLSSRTDIPVNTLKQVEADRTTPPLGALVRLGKALELKMGYFISPPTAEKPMTVVRSASRLQVARRGKKVREKYGYVYESLAPEKSNRLMEPFLVTMTPTDFKEASAHDGQEFLFVLEGEIQTQVGDQIEVLRPGDSVYYDSSEPHLVTCHGKKPARILAMVYAGTK